MTSASNQPDSRLRAYLELFRLPNVFTAMADVFLGFLFTHGDLELWPVFVALLAASSVLYMAGMVLNDVFDFEVDAVERPARPLPSGRIPRGTAQALGFSLLAAGAAFGWTASAFGGSIRSGLVASLLAVAVLLYDKVLKRTPLAPLAMGGCRMLNVLLGMSAGGAWYPMHWMVAGGVGLYIVGVTWFARTEARRSNRAALAAATVVMVAGMALLAWYPSRASDALRNTPSWPGEALAIGQRWPLLWAILAALTVWRCLVAVIQPVPQRVQPAVKHAILSLIVIDAAACFGPCGILWATMILLLLVPTMFLGRWIYST